MAAFRAEYRRRSEAYQRRKESDQQMRRRIIHQRHITKISRTTHCMQPLPALRPPPTPRPCFVNRPARIITPSRDPTHLWPDRAHSGGASGFSWDLPHGVVAVGSMGLNAGGMRLIVGGTWLSVGSWGILLCRVGWGLLWGGGLLKRWKFTVEI